ncbi:MAG TPA: hypothetical protein VNF02_02870 [Candidatus Limnocylindrales bacterium]|nr:hypothetical protein [Candidatus Limnocylindrales bacterium]
MMNSSAGPSLNVLIATGEICQSVRSKTLFYQQDENASDARSAAPFWCSRTQSMLGPDGKPVGVDECRPGRSCCNTA